MTSKKYNRKNFILNILLPTFLAISLFVISIFVIIIPTFENNILDRKREMIRELTNSALSILVKIESEEKQGKFSKEEAQEIAKSRIGNLRYGEENKDYFWITDMHPKMIIHPYRTDLNGTDVSNFQDPHGKKLFIEMVKVCKEKHAGYVDYMWQWKDDSLRIVPKLSYVVEFKPWGWIIGTGIYIEDVKEEIASIQKRLVNISFGIIGIIALLLVFIAHQSFKIERKRRKTEEALKLSREKYRAIVEITTEGTIMILEGKFIYANKTILNILKYSEQEFFDKNIFDIFPEGEKNIAFKYFKNLIEGKQITSNFDAQLLDKEDNSVDVALTISKINVENQKGYIIIAKDISVNKQIKEELGVSKEKYKYLINNIEVGIFRTEIGIRGKFIEANPATLKILGFKNKEDLFATNIFKLFYDPKDRNILFKNLISEGFVKNRIIHLKKDDGTNPTISVSLVIVKDENGDNKYCDGVVEDITEIKKREQERENLIIELQTSLLFLNQPIKNFIKNVTSCEINTTVKKAATIMTKEKNTAILIKSGTGDNIGIVTDTDLRKRAIVKNNKLDNAVFEIMSSPIISITDSALVYEAILLMQEKKITHLAIEDINNKIISIVNYNELLQIQPYSTLIFIKEISNASDVDDIIESHKKMPRMIKALIDSGANSQNIARIMTTISDSIIHKLIELAIEELGTPPAKFAFITLGSVGRKEQTLVTDQDNAIIIEDVPKEKSKEINKYFLKLGEKVCTSLNDVGYNFCEGKIMAMNPEWCQDLLTWKKYFAKWINTLEPKDLLDVSIFFDFRFVYGENYLTDNLREQILQLINKQKLFFYHLTTNSLQYKPPLNVFGNITVETIKGHKNVFDIKKAIMPIINFARIYSWKNNIDETNTIKRINQLYENNIITKSNLQEIEHAYNYLMLMRLKYQAIALNENKTPVNYINPNILTNIEQSTLKKIFTQITEFQTKLRLDFKGNY